MKNPILISLDIVYDGDDPSYIKVVKNSEPLGMHKVEDPKHIKLVRDLLIALSSYCGDRLSEQ